MQASSLRATKSNGSHTTPTPLIGKDILELLSSSMYVDPMTIYREYVQNAADAIDDAFRQGVLSGSDPRTISIDFDPKDRSVRIRDNGIGVSENDFVSLLTRVGASDKSRIKNR